MKLLKITGIVFVVTIVLSSLGVNAETYLTFAGITISGHSTQYTSSQCEKTMTSEQYYKHRSAYDTLTGVLRNLDIRIVDSGTSQETAWKEFEQGDLKVFPIHSLKMLENIN